MSAIILLSSALFISTSIPIKSDTSEDIGADFLEFLADIDEATGDGFSLWLETESATDTNENTEIPRK